MIWQPMTQSAFTFSVNHPEITLELSVLELKQSIMCDLSGSWCIQVNPGTMWVRTKHGELPHRVCKVSISNLLSLPVNAPDVKWGWGSQAENGRGGSWVLAVRGVTIGIKAKTWWECGVEWTHTIGGDGPNVQGGHCTSLVRLNVYPKFVVVD